VNDDVSDRDIDELADTAMADAGQRALATTAVAEQPRGKAGDLGSALTPSGSAGNAGDGRESRAIERDSRYRVIGEHARGGLGRVLKAQDERLGREVAIKELLRSTSFAEALFLREALITARLQHPGIVPVHEAGRWDSGDPYYVMKLVAGKSLQELILGQSSLRERMSLLPHVIDVVETIAYAHSQGVIHRDIKPANILVGDFGETVVVDWGLARDDQHPVTSVHSLAQAMMDSGDSGDPSATGTVWQVSGNYSISGKVIGTPAYMPPEQARGQDVDERGDVYALGALLYELLSGQRPYPGNNLQEVLGQVLAGPPIGLAERLVDSDHRVPADLIAIVDKAMARERSDRYPTAMELAADLKRFQTGKMVSVHEYSSWTLVRRWLWRHRAPVAVALVALIVVGIIGVLSMRRVIEERNTAEVQRSRAQQARHAAETGQNELLLLQARSWLDEDPTATIAWLKKAPLGEPYFTRARQLYQDAVSRGVSRHVFGLPDNATSLSYLPDGRRVVVVSEDGTLHLFDLERGTRRTFAGAERQPSAVSPDGALVAMGTHDGPIRLVALGEGQGVRMLRGHRGRTKDLQFSSDGARLVSDGADGTTRIWDVAREIEIARIDLPHGAVAFTSDLGRAAFGMGKGAVRLVDPSTGATLADIVLPAPAMLLRFAPDGHALAALGWNKQVYWIDTRSGAVTPLDHAMAYGPRSLLEFSPAGTWLVFAHDNWAIRLWNTTSKEFKTLTGHQNNIFDVAFSADERLLASASDDSTVRLWDLHSNNVRVLRGHSDDVLQVAFSPAGDTLATGSMDKSLRIWPVHSDGTSTLSGHAEPLTALTFAGPEQLIVAGTHGEFYQWSLPERRRRVVAKAHPGAETWNQVVSRDGRFAVALNHPGRFIELWDLRAGTHEVFEGTPEHPYNFGFASDGSAFSVLEYDGSKAMIWRQRSGEMITLERDTTLCSAVVAPGGEQVALVSPARLEVVDIETRQTIADVELRYGDRPCFRHDVATGARFSADGTWLAAAETRRGVVLWNSRDNTVRRFDTGRYHVHAFAISPDNAMLAAAHTDRSITVLDIVTGQSRTLGNHDDVVWAMEFSPDGKVLATSSYDHTVRLWSLATGAVQVLRGFSESVHDVAFSPDGKRLAGVSEDRTARVWDLSRELIANPDALHVHIEASTTAIVEASARVVTPAADSP
jgi:WD40 repeat protein/serine/threonine protein kinase